MKQINEIKRMQQLAGIITESKLNEAENLLSLIKSYVSYDYTADQGYGTFTDDETGEEVDVVDNAEEQMKEIKIKIIAQKGEQYFELVKKFASLSTYDAEQADQEESKEIQPKLKELSGKLGFTMDQLRNI